MYWRRFSSVSAISQKTGVASELPGRATAVLPLARHPRHHARSNRPPDAPIFDLAPVSPAAGRGFVLAQRLRQASTELGAVSSLISWRRVGCSLIRSTHLRLIATLP